MASSVAKKARDASTKDYGTSIRFENNRLGFYFISLFILYYRLRIMKTKCDTVTGHMTDYKNHMSM